MAELSMTHYTVQGRNGPGIISVQGVHAGDVIINIQYNDHGVVIESHGPFERLVSSDDQLVQTSLVDLSSLLPFHVYVVR
jgi:hypothetical protein